LKHAAIAFQRQRYARIEARLNPSASGCMRNASETAAPPLLPPAERVKSYALRVAP
jgi:hypothetical protein